MLVYWRGPYGPGRIRLMKTWKRRHDGVLFAREGRWREKLGLI